MQAAELPQGHDHCPKRPRENEDGDQQSNDGAPATKRRVLCSGSAQEPTNVELVPPRDDATTPTRITQPKNDSAAANAIGTDLDTGTNNSRVRVMPGDQHSNSQDNPNQTAKPPSVACDLQGPSATLRLGNLVQIPDTCSRSVHEKVHRWLSESHLFDPPLPAAPAPETDHQPSDIAEGVSLGAAESGVASGCGTADTRTHIFGKEEEEEEEAEADNPPCTWSSL